MNEEHNIFLTNNSITENSIKFNDCVKNYTKRWLIK